MPFIVICDAYTFRISTQRVKGRQIGHMLVRAYFASFKGYKNICFKLLVWNCGLLCLISDGCWPQGQDLLCILLVSHIHLTCVPLSDASPTPTVHSYYWFCRPCHLITEYCWPAHRRVLVKDRTNFQQEFRLISSSHRADSSLFYRIHDVLIGIECAAGVPAALVFALKASVHAFYRHRSIARLSLQLSSGSFLLNREYVVSAAVFGSRWRNEHKQMAKSAPASASAATEVAAAPVTNNTTLLWTCACVCMSACSLLSFFPNNLFRLKLLPLHLAVIFVRPSVRITAKKNEVGNRLVQR